MNKMYITCPICSTPNDIEIWDGNSGECAYCGNQYYVEEHGSEEVGVAWERYYNKKFSREINE